MAQIQLSTSMTVAEVQTEWPQTIAVFREYAAVCIGCDLAPFCTLAEAANELDVSLPDFMRDLETAVSEADSTVQ